MDFFEFGSTRDQRGSQSSQALKRKQSGLKRALYVFLSRPQLPKSSGRYKLDWQFEFNKFVDDLNFVQLLCVF